MAVAATVGVLIGLLIGHQFGGTPIGAFLSEWQTLIAGLLAAGAALWTVTETRASSERLIAVQLAPERLRLTHGARALERAMKATEAVESAVSAVEIDLRPILIDKIGDTRKLPAGDKAYRDLSRQWRAVHSLAAEISAAFDDPDYKAAEPFLEADVVEAQKRLTAEARSFTKALNEPGSPHPGLNAGSIYNSTFEALRAHFEVLTEDTAALRRYDHQLRDAYTRQLDRYPMPPHHLQ